MCSSTPCLSSARASSANSTGSRYSAAREGCAAPAIRCIATRADGTFEDVSAKAGVADPQGRFGMGAAWADFDGDGRPDLFVANDAGPNFLYRNTGNGTFVDVALQAGTALSEDGEEQGSMGVAVGDYDHSGGRAILVTNFSDEYNALYRHDKAFQFTDVSFASQTAARQPPVRRLGHAFRGLRQRRLARLLVVNGHVYPQVEQAGVPTRYRAAQAAVPQRPERHVHGNDVRPRVPLSVSPP